MTRKTLQGHRRVVRRTAFRRFWLGMMISRAGDAFTIVALSWVVLGIGGPAQLGLVLMCFGLPRIVGGPVAGHLLDRFRPRLLLAADNAARGLLIGAVPVLLWQHRLAVADLYAIAVVCALLSSVTAFERTLVQRLVPADVRSRVAGARMTISSLGFPLGSALGGALIGRIGGSGMVVAIACSYLALGLLPLLAPALRELGQTQAFPGLDRT